MEIGMYEKEVEDKEIREIAERILPDTSFGKIYRICEQYGEEEADCREYDVYKLVTPEGDRMLKKADKREVSNYEKYLKQKDFCVPKFYGRWDDGAGMSYAMRSKEDTSDYKYFPEPDIPPVVVSTPDIEKIKNQMPELPQAKRRRWSEEYNLGRADIDTLMSSPFTAELFDRTVMLCKSAKDAASWINVELPAVLRGAGMSIEDAKFSPDSLGRLINMLSSGEINRGTAKKVFAKIVTENADPAEYVRKNGLSLMTDAAAIEDAVKRVIAENEKSVSQYRDGKTQAFQYLIGQCMRALGGKAPASAVTETLKRLI